jgi:type IV pilus assembly protein PilA
VRAVRHPELRHFSGFSLGAVLDCSGAGSDQPARGADGMNETTKKKGLPTWAIVLIVVAVGAPIALGIFSALAIYGVRKYIMNAKRAEAAHVLASWSKGMVTCGEKDGLPLTSAPVPASLAAVSGKKYQSASSEWSDPAFVCAGFSVSDPQYFQYQWVQVSPAEGSMLAQADLDGDGNVDERVEVRVSCNAGRCTASPSSQP